jgi:HAD superfamily hydrolase (TIGR01549 family)
MIKAVLFDLFETLVTQYDPGFFKKDREIYNVLSMEKDLFSSEFAKTRNGRHLGQYENRREAFIEIAGKYSLSVDMEKIIKYEKELDHLKSRAFENIDSSVIGMLREVKKLDVRICIITNCEYFEEHYYYESRLPHYLDEVLFSCEEKVAKPDKEIYQRALLKLGLTCEECIYVGDGGTSELQGAKAIGIDAFQAYWFLKQYDEEYQMKCFQPFERLYEPLDVLRKIN